MLENFHFLAPWWLLALVPALWLAWRLLQLGDGAASPWRRVIDARLLALLASGDAGAPGRTVPALVALGWTLAVLALADPAWERAPQPVLQTATARVLVLDLAQSMYADDLKPSRLVRARYKISDALDLAGEGQTGLVAYAGDAFTVAPLTRDAKTIRSLLPVLDPALMPVEGGRADLGLLKAGELLHQAGATHGTVLLFADDIGAADVAATTRAAARLNGEGYQVSILGIGTQDGAPLRNAKGVLLRDAAGNVGISHLNATALEAIAQAGGGQYRPISDDGAALRELLRDTPAAQARDTAQASGAAQRWKEMGPALAALLLPLAALAFRRNWLVGALLLAGVVSAPEPAMATGWTDLWQRPDQQAAHALHSGDFPKAASLAEPGGLRGAAEYKSGKFAEAAADFARESGPDADFNRGNALARLGRYTDAIAAYDRALKAAPDNADARANKAAVEDLLRKMAQSPKAASDAKGRNAQRSPDTSAGGSQDGGNAPNDGKGAKDGENGKDGKDGKKGNARDGGKARQEQASNPSAGSGGDRPSSPSGKPDQRAAQGMDGSAGAAGQSAPAPPPDGSPARKQASSTAGPPAASSTRAVPAGGAPGNASAATGLPQGATQFADAARKLATAAAGSDEKSASRDISGSTAPGREQPQMPEAHVAKAAGAEPTQPLDTEEQQAAEQWLRRIPDDPGALLRRKFLYQYRQRTQNAADTSDTQ